MNTQFQKGQAARFFWAPDAMPSAAPDVAFGSPISTTKTLAKLRADGAVASIGADLMTVTLSAGIGGSSRGLVGQEGAAFLDLGQAGLFPVRIAAFDSATVVRLAEPLPYAPGTGASGTLAWNVWYADLNADEVGDAVARRIAWSIRWTETEGADHPGRLRHDRGLVDVVTVPFSTGVTNETLLALVPLLSRLVPGRQRSWMPQIDLALAELVGWLEELLPPARFVDMLDGTQFKLVHAQLAAHYIIRGHQSVGYSRPDVDFLADARAEFSRHAKRLRWLDADGDGVVDDGETDGSGLPAPGTPTALWLEDDYEATDFEDDR